MSAQSTGPEIGRRERSQSPAEILESASNWRQMIEDFRPLAESLDWRLANAHWITNGVTSFINGKVPWLINNDGGLSADAAAVLFANCVEAPPGPEGITLLELGAGTGLFARYFLDEFETLCRQESRDFYERLTYVVTDRSPATVEFWRAQGIFTRHGAHAQMLAADASHPETAVRGPLRAAFCNYILDTLPFATLRKTESGWEQLWARAWITRDEEVLRLFTNLSFDQIAECVRSGDLEPLFPLMHLLETERRFFPVSAEESQDLPHGAIETGQIVPCNHGALACLKGMLAMLDPAGFVLVYDYGASRPEESGRFASGQQFGPATAMGLNFPLLEACCGASVCTPEGDNATQMHARLFHGGAPTTTRQEFLRRFAPETRQLGYALEERARAEVAAGNWQQALRTFQAAIEQNPRNWHLLGEAAEFAGTQLRAYPQALHLAEAALELNPWYSPWLWNLKGEVLARLERYEEAHQCHLRAEAICPEDANTQLYLAGSFLRLGDPGRSLQAIATGLAHDSACQLRHLFVEKQAAALAALTIRWTREHETVARRQAAALPPEGE